MNFDKYINRREYPRISDFTTVYYYGGGKVVGVKEPDGNYYLIMPDGSRKWVDALPAHGAAEKVVDTVTYYALRDEWNTEENRLNELFKQDLFEQLGIQDNPKRDLLFEKAWERGHANGHGEVYNVALDLVDLIL